MNDTQDIRGTVINLAGMVEYQDGSVVSRTILNKNTGTLTLFAFDAGQSLSEHTAPFDAFAQVLDGEAEIIIGGEPKRVRAGEMVIMPANISHAVKAPGRFKMFLAMIREKVS